MARSRSQNLSLQGPFILLGFPGPRSLHIGLFLLFLVMYVLTVAGNLAIISLVGAHRRLQISMYFFLCNLSFLEIWFTTACVSKTLTTFASQSGAISLAGCATQMYFVFSLGCTEYFLLAAMAYDRYLAICLPLRYGGIMTPAQAVRLALGSWLCGFSAITVPATLITRLSFCGSRVINHFFCDIAPWIVLSCTDTRVVELTSFGIAFCVILGSCCVTLVSYAYIIVTIVRIPSTQGRHRAFSTCSSHLTVVLIWYGSTIFLHVRTSVESSLDLTKAVTVLNTIIMPVLNPFIYTLRNKDVKEALCRTVKGR
ncbi:olfactory receptor 287 [Erethizon dorsatum]